ncbi:alpha/beta fold hydrolase [Streptomyces sp. CSDS2]|uniref:thioesterase domain-containing protein n=1 Tax=Streptomyces sp. CSDS2 TaxID=3055051 RepID=UPI0025AFFBBE|nr:thioesterase domain-containing protein [Streptomyces sp. CSDS2]MDN3259864.1 alpha/beta fold hydrolase [Streptomyces sp. CSDS2]
MHVDDTYAARRARHCLPTAERDRLAARLEPHRHRAECANAALRILAAHASTGALPLPQLAPDARGKPLLTAWGGAGTRRLGLHVSLAHAGPYAAVALSGAGPVGVDIEDTAPLPDQERFARGILADREHAEWSVLAGHQRAAAVIRAFTRKEAVLKALGTGLAGGLREVATALRGPSGDRVRLHRLPDGAGPPGAWTVLDLAAPSGLCGAVAVHVRDAVVHEHRTTIADLLRTAPLPRRRARSTPVAAPPPYGSPRPSAATGRARTDPPHTTSHDHTKPPHTTDHHHTKPPHTTDHHHTKPPYATDHRGEHRMRSTTPAQRPLTPAADTAAPDGLQLFCLPHAGGNSAHFRGWDWLAPHARAVPVDLPGHGTRLGEPLVEDWESLVADLTESVAERVAGPFALFGHSLGALLAFDISHRLLARGLAPALLVAAGRNGPSAPPAHRPVHPLPDEPFIGALRRLGGMPDALLRQPELLRMFLPVLRADLRLAERYTRPGVGPLPLPVVAFAGADDPMTDDLGMRAWQAETTRAFALTFVEGGHFFLDSPRFATALVDRLARPLDP